MAHKITITITTGNSAFGETEYEEAAEIHRILNNLGEQMVSHPSKIMIFDGKRLIDFNGNKVGTVTVEPC